MRPDPRQLETSFKQTKAWLPSDPTCQSQRHLSGPVSHDLSPPCVPLPSVPVTPLSRSSFGSSVSFPNPSPPTPEGPDPSLEGSVPTCSAERSLPTPVAAASTCRPRASRCRAAAGAPLAPSRYLLQNSCPDVPQAAPTKRALPLASRSPHSRFLRWTLCWSAVSLQLKV